MIRFIIKRKVLDRHSEAEYTRLYTLLLDVPELERELAGGGMDMNAHDIRELLGVEIGVESESTADDARDAAIKDLLLGVIGLSDYPDLQIKASRLLEATQPPTTGEAGK